MINNSLLPKNGFNFCQNRPENRTHLNQSLTTQEVVDGFAHKHCHLVKRSLIDIDLNHSSSKESDVFVQTTAVSARGITTAADMRTHVKI